MKTSDQISKMAAELRDAKHALVFTGAGISTLSGIPDFRGAHGVYRKKWHGLEVEEILSLDCFRVHPEYFYEWAQTFVYGLENYQPNIVHTTVAKLEKLGWIDGVYTQNIDILHQKAGSRKLYELHGSPAHHHCLNCGASADYDEVAPVVQAGSVPYCEKCGEVLKPDIVFYGEMLDEALLEQAFREFSRADFVLILGSSLTVQPAASLPLYTLRHGGKIAIVNQGATALDRDAAYRFDDLEQVFTELARLLPEA